MKKKLLIVGSAGVVGILFVLCVAIAKAEYLSSQYYEATHWKCKCTNRTVTFCDPCNVYEDFYGIAGIEVKETKYRKICKRIFG